MGKREVFNWDIPLKIEPRRVNLETLGTQYNSLIDSYTKANTGLKNAVEEIEQLQGTITNLLKDNRTLLQSNTKNITDITKANQKLSSLETALNRSSADMSALQQNYNKLLKDLNTEKAGNVTRRNAVDQKMGKFNDRIESVDGQIKDMAANFTSLGQGVDAAKAAADQANATVIKEISGFESRLNDMAKASKKFTPEQLTLVRQELGTLKENLINNEFKVLNTKFMDIKKKLDEFDFKGFGALPENVDPPVTRSIGEISQSLFTSLESAMEETKTSNFKLSNITLDIKGLGVDKGFQLLDISHTPFVDPALVSSISMELSSDDPGEGSGAESTDDEFTMPDFSGMTESAAGNLIDKMGLRLRPVYQTVKKGKYPIGQCINQSPAPGTALGFQETITLIFAKGQDNG